MLAIERRTEIMELIQKDRTVKVSELSERFNVVEETIRRDLDKLDKEGKVKKTYGGAILVDNVSADMPFGDRRKTNLDKKEKIAEYANELIGDGETIFIDMSTTALEVIKAVSPDKKITVLTNSLTALSELSMKDNVQLIGIGGNFDESTQSMIGPVTYKFIGHYYADKTLISVKGITKDRGIMDSKEELAEIKRHMSKNAKETVLLIDSSKFNQSAMVSVIDMNEISQIVTDYVFDESWLEYLASCDVLTHSVQ